MESQKAITYISKLFSLVQSISITSESKDKMNLENGINEVISMLRTVNKAGGKVMLIGNGGSAAISLHIQNDLCNKLRIRAMVFTEPALLTAVSNDYGYSSSFKRPIELWAGEDDLLFSFSSSGSSDNIIRATLTCRNMGVKVVTFTGFSKENRLRKLGHLNFYTPSKSYGHIELSHAILGHMITDSATQGRSLNSAFDVKTTEVSSF